MARVTLCNPQNGATVSDVPMLLDSGADVTLVPQTLTSQLGIEIDLSEGYELIGFDGRTSLAHVVQLDLLFLKRAFKGRLLLIDQEWGLIGRDILNHLTVVFDGPRLIWSEGTSSGN